MSHAPGVSAADASWPERGAAAQRPASGADVRVSALTDVGRTREHNEDAFLVAELTAPEPLDFPPVDAEDGASTPAERGADVARGGLLLLVADGLGGAAAGEVASHLAARTAYDAIRRTFAASDTDAVQGPVAVAAALRAAVLAANDAVHRLGSERSELHGMASTLTAALVRGTEVTVAQVGDSRAYVIRGGEARQITKDQSLVQRLVDAGEMTPEQAETSLRRNIILQALGPEPGVRVDVTRQTLHRGDVLLLCSDGLSGQVRAADLADAARVMPGPGTLCAALVAAANASGGPDNITVVAARLTGEAFPEGGPGAAPVAPESITLETPADGVPAAHVAHRVRPPATPAATPVPVAEAVRPARATPTDETAALVVLPTPAPREAPGVPGRVVRSRRARVPVVYGVLAVAAVVAAVWTYLAFMR